MQAQQLQTANPEQALQLAQRANQLAGQAIQYAQNDVGAFQGRRLGGMLGGGGGRRQQRRRDARAPCSAAS